MWPNRVQHLCIGAGLYRYGVEPLLSIRFPAGLFARFERQRFGKLNCDTAQEAIDVIDPTDMTWAGETYHIEVLSVIEAWYTKACG